MTQKLPLPITRDMLLPANENAGRPYYTTEVMGRSVDPAADWHGGDAGNDVDHAEATQAIGHSDSAQTEHDYDPQHQEAKGKDMHQPMTPLSDLGKDYGVGSGLTYRDGTIEPRTPYPSQEQPT